MVVEYIYVSICKDLSPFPCPCSMLSLLLPIYSVLTCLVLCVWLGAVWGSRLSRALWRVLRRCFARAAEGWQGGAVQGVCSTKDYCMCWRIYFEVPVGFCRPRVVYGTFPPRMTFSSLVFVALYRWHSWDFFFLSALLLFLTQVPVVYEGDLFPV